MKIPILYQKYLYDIVEITFRIVLFPIWFAWRFFKQIEEDFNRRKDEW